jgi:hypothetical protein
LAGFCFVISSFAAALALFWAISSFAASQHPAKQLRVHPPSVLKWTLNLSSETMATLSPPLSPSAEFSPSGVNSSRPRAVSALSNHSKRSRRSNSSGAKLDLTETHAEKKYLHTKADPSKALNEAQPGEPPKDAPKKKVHFADNPVSASVALEESNLGDLRSMVHKDAAGNIISKLAVRPDRWLISGYWLAIP